MSTEKPTIDDLIADIEEIVGGNAVVTVANEQIIVTWDEAQLGMNYRARAASAQRTRQKQVTNLVGDTYEVVFV